MPKKIDTPASIAAAPTSLAWTTPDHVEVGGAAAVTVTDAGGQAYVVGGAAGVSVDSPDDLDQVFTAAGSTNTITVDASAVVNSLGYDTITAGPNISVTVSGTANISGGTGSNTYTVYGTATIASRATGSDLINAVTGSTVSLASTGSNFHLGDFGAAVHVSETGGGDNSVVSLAGGGALVSGGAGQGLTVSTNAGASTQVTLGAGKTTVLSNGNDAITGGSGANLFNVAGAATLLSQSAGMDIINALAGASLNATVTGHAVLLGDFGAAVHVSETGGGDNSVVSLAGGGALVSGGAGQGLTVSTNAGASTQVTLGAGKTTVLSNGNDAIQDSTGSHDIEMSGNATVTTQSTSADIIKTLAGSNATVNVTSNQFILNNMNGTVKISETGGGDNLSRRWQRHHIRGRRNEHVSLRRRCGHPIVDPGLPREPKRR